LTPVPGKSLNYSFVARRLGEQLGDFDVESVAYDRWRIDDLRRELDAEGVDIELREFGQGFKDMAPAVDFLEELIISGKLRVCVNPVLKWNVASAVLEEDAAGNRKFTKRKATGRIDGIVALVMAIGNAMGRDDDGPSVYQTRGVVTL
jgi:phage terminase large subunit-like protein